jgi:uncharacterized protein involved in response to NO
VTLYVLTVGFVAAMVFAIGKPVLPAFAGNALLYSPRLTLTSLLLNAGCTLRVSSEILAYESYWLPAWKAPPLSAICELAAATVFCGKLASHVARAARATCGLRTIVNASSAVAQRMQAAVVEMP